MSEIHVNLAVTSTKYPPYLPTCLDMHKMPLIEGGTHLPCTHLMLNVFMDNVNIFSLFWQSIWIKLVAVVVTTTTTI